MAWLDFLLGRDEKTQQFQRFTPQQQELQQQQIGGVSEQLPQMFQYLQQILSNDPDLMRQFQAPSRRAFEEQTIPTIAERFTGMGAQKSSAFGQQLGQAGVRLEEGLAAQQGNLKGKAAAQLQQLLKGGMESQFDTLHTEGGSGFIDKLPQIIMTIMSMI